MTTYKVEATVGTVVLSELITLDTNLPPEDEINHAEDVAILHWRSIFNYDFYANADEITTYAIKELL